MSTAQKLIGVSSEDYHATDAISHSKLEVFRRRPALYKKRFIDKTVPAPTSTAFAVGSALHCAVLEPNLFASRYTIKPEGMERRSNAGKAAWAAWEAAHVGVEILEPEDMASVQAMAKAVREHETAAALLASGLPEVSWRANVAGLPLPAQCRTDWFNETGCALSDGRPYVVDAKTVDSLDGDFARAFQSAFVKYGYPRQCGFYLPLLQECGIQWPVFFFAAVEKKEPFGVQVFKPTDAVLAAGLDENASDLRALAKCYHSGVWPNLPLGVTEIDLPRWYGES